MGTSNSWKQKQAPSTEATLLFNKHSLPAEQQLSALPHSFVSRFFLFRFLPFTQKFHRYDWCWMQIEWIASYLNYTHLGVVFGQHPIKNCCCLAQLLWRRYSYSVEWKCMPAKAKTEHFNWDTFCCRMFSCRIFIVHISRVQFIPKNKEERHLFPQKVSFWPV